MPEEQFAKMPVLHKSKSFRLIEWVWRVGASVVSAVVVAAVAAFFLVSTVILLMIGLFGAGCTFTERVVDRTILSSAEMRFDYLDPDRDIADITGTVLGGGGGGVGGC